MALGMSHDLRPGNAAAGPVAFTFTMSLAQHRSTAGR